MIIKAKGPPKNWFVKPGAGQIKEEKVIYRDAPASKIPAQPTTNHPLSCVVYSVSF